MRAHRAHHEGRGTCEPAASRATADPAPQSRAARTAEGARIRAADVRADHGGMGGLAKRRCGIRQPGAAPAAEGGAQYGKKAGLVPPKRVSPLPDFRVEGGCPEEGCRGETRRGEPILSVPPAALSVKVRVYPRAHSYGVSIAVIVKSMVKSR